MRRSFHWIIEQKQCRNVKPDCIWWQKQFELQIVPWMHKFWLLLKPNQLSNRPTFWEQQFRAGALLIFHVAHFAIIFNNNSETNLLFNIGSKGKHKNAFGENVWRRCKTSNIKNYTSSQISQQLGMQTFKTEESHKFSEFFHVVTCLVLEHCLMNSLKEAKHSSRDSHRNKN